MKTTLMFGTALCAGILLSGCIDSVGLQREYVASRDACREKAESKMGTYSQSGAVNDEHKDIMITMFNECMQEKKWKIAKTKEPPKDAPKDTPPGKQVAGDPVPPVGNTLPISTAAMARPAVAPAGAAPAAAAPGTMYMLVPVPAQPAPAAPAPVPAPGQPAVQYYQAPPAAVAPVPAAVPEQPQPQPKTVLRNKGIGVGVGPTYSLEKMIEKE